MAAYDPQVAETGTLHIQRLGPHDAELARTTFAVMAEVFGEMHTRLSDAYVAALLARPDFWGFAATHAGRVVGGLTAHVLLLTAREGAEVFLYDIAVAPDHQRRGVGRHLVEALRREASHQGISTIFVPADDDDPHALRFYAALGGRPSKVTLFELSPPGSTTTAGSA
jgi:aminoglycoside 3-N-acetyltransferase I